MPKHRHAEAFYIMHYRCGECAWCGIIWNSRDGVTPFGIKCPKCGEPSAMHVDWDQDTYCPDLQPASDMLVFIDLPDSFRRVCALRTIASCDGTSLELVGEERERMIKVVAADYKAESPFLIRMP